MWLLFWYFWRLFYHKKIHAHKLNNWKGKTFCGQRINSNYLNFSIVESNSNCPSKEKSCGIIDSLNNTLCVSIDSQCPINDVIVLKNVNNSDIIFNDNNSNGIILNQFEISEEQPCINNLYQKRKMEPYVLDPFHNKSECKEGYENIVYDYNYIKFENITYKELYTDNKLTNIIRILPRFEFSSWRLEIETNLYYRNYIGVNPSCIKRIKNKFNFDKLINYLTNLNEESNKIKSNSSLNNTLLGIMLIIPLVIEILFWVYYNKKQKKYMLTV
jgi:hypothetical protein